MRRSLQFATLGFSCWIAACGGEPSGPIDSLPRPLTAAEEQLVASGNAFAFDLFHQVVAETDPGANMFVSPLSVAMALGMTLNGAAGETETAMRSALRLNTLTGEDANRSFRDLIDLLTTLDRRVEFAIGNSVWAREGYAFEPAFLDVARQFFDARVEALDFDAPEAAAAINAWVDEQTRGRIPEIVPDALPSDVVMYLINAIYFKGDWTQPFDIAQTTDRSFHLASGGSADVPTMAHGAPIEVRSGRGDGVTVLELPYARGAFSMVVVVPDEGSSIEAMIDDIGIATWGGWQDLLHDGEALIHLPRFSYSFEVTLNDALAALGMGVAFSGSADFTRLSPDGGLFIDEVKHKAFVEVDEEGTEAAAATSVSMAVSVPPIIEVNRPFLFVLRERFSGTVLFLGRVMDPR